MRSRAFHSGPPTPRRVYRINVFTRSEKSGNPAAVVVGFQGNDHAMQKMAAKINLPATVFVLPSQDPKFDAHLRFYSPTAELPMCGHGALAASVAVLEGEVKTAKVSTIKSNIELTRTDQSLVQMILPKAVRQTFDQNLRDKVCDLLDVNNESLLDRNLPYGIASVGVPLLFVPIVSREQLFALQPKKDALLKWTQEQSLGGIYAYTSDTIHKNSTFHARCFNPRFNNNFEDIATGAAAAALASIHSEKFPGATEIIIEQGTILGKESQIYITPDQDRLKVGGYLTILNATLEQDNNSTLSYGKI